MKDNDLKSFEKVELFTPIELISIQGIEENPSKTFYLPRAMECNEITDIEEKNGYLSMTIKGNSVLDKEAYVVLYKEGKIVSVMCNPGIFNVDETVIKFNVSDVEHDLYDIYY